MKNSYSRKIMLSFIGICLSIVAIYSGVFYGISKKIIAEKHTLVISDYTKQTVFYVNKQMERLQGISELLMFDDWFKYILRQEYDNYGAYDIMMNQMLPKCQNVLKIYGEPINATLYVHNHTLNEHYSNQQTDGIGIRYADMLEGDPVVAQMRNSEKYVLWAQTQQDKEDGTVSLYARLIDFEKMSEEGVLVFRVKADTLFPDVNKENNPAVFFEIEGNGFTLERSNSKKDNSREYVTEEMPLSTNNFKLVAFVSKSYYGSPIRESAKWVFLVFIMIMPIMLFLGFVFKHLLYKDVDLILSGIRRVQNGENDCVIEGGKNEEFRQIADVLNEYIRSVEHLVSDVYEIEIQKQDIEFSMLQAKINPHFLYNIFTIMSEFAKAGFNEAVVRVLDKTAAFYRQILSKGTGDYTLGEELECVRAYIEIIDIIKPKETSIRYEIDETVLGAYMPRFLLQPIVENSIKHAMQGKQLIITISAREENGKLIIEVADNGIGMSAEQLENCTRYKASSGYGIYNIISRLRLRYAEPGIGLKVMSREGEGTKAIFILPCITDYPEDDMYE